MEEQQKQIDALTWQLKRGRDADLKSECPVRSEQICGSGGSQHTLSKIQTKEKELIP